MKTEQQKEITYAYPSSPNAVKFGLKNGGYIVKNGNPVKPMREMAGFENLIDAKAFADALPMQYTKWTL